MPFLTDLCARMGSALLLCGSAAAALDACLNAECSDSDDGLHVMQLLQVSFETEASQRLVVAAEGTGQSQSSATWFFAVIFLVCAGIALYWYTPWGQLASEHMKQMQGYFSGLPAETLLKDEFAPHSDSTDNGLLIECQKGSNFEALPPSSPFSILAAVGLHARERPDATAVIDVQADVTVSYKVLAIKMDSLAKALRQAGIKDGHIVGLLLEPSLRFTVASLGVMQAGAVWLPLDTKSPAERIQQLLDGAGATLLLATDDSFKQCWQGDVWVIDAQGHVPQTLSLARERSANAVKAPANTAMIFYTSGSTGKPKAVIYGHETLYHGAATFATLVGATAESTFLVKTPTIWAVCEYETFSAICAGAIAVADSRCQRDAVRLASTIKDHGITTLVTSAPVLQMLIEDNTFPTLRNVVNVGGALPLDVCDSTQRALGPDARIHNMYGCTETPCLQWTYNASIVQNLTGMAPAGYPQPGVDVYIVGSSTGDYPVPLGAEGEILIGGRFLSSGYLNNEQENKARFVPCPGTKEKGLVYRTGDIGRWFKTKDGKLALKVEGRCDRQLNINGVRISPEEVETVIAQAPGVDHAGVVAIGEAGSERMVACVAGNSKELGSSVKSFCESRLPTHMRPFAVLHVEKFPLLANGKINLGELKAHAVKQVEIDDVSEVADSFGQMRKVKKGAVEELEMLDVYRGIASCSVLVYHWFWWLNAESHIPDAGPGFHNFLVCFASTFWAMFAFAGASAIQDRKQRRLALPAQLQTEAFVLFVYLMIGGPVAKIMNFVFMDVLHNHGELAPYNGHWYLLFVLMTRAMHHVVFCPMLALIRKYDSKWHLHYIAGLFFTILAALFVKHATSSAPNMCPYTSSVDSPWFKLAVFFSDSDETKRLQPGHCPLMTPYHWSETQNLVMAYSIGWWFGKDTYRFFCHRASSSRAALAWLAVVAVFTAFALRHPHDIELQRSEDEGRVDYEVNETFFVRAFDLTVVCLLLIAAALTVKVPFYGRKLLVEAGKVSLGCYILSIMVVCGGVWGRYPHSVMESWCVGYQPGNINVHGRSIFPSAVELTNAMPGDALKCAALMLYWLYFTLTFAWIWQKGLTVSFGWICRNRQTQIAGTCLVLAMMCKWGRVRGLSKFDP